MPNPIKKSAIFLPCFIIIQSISICFSAEVKTIAVIDFDAQNTSKADANIISDFLRNVHTGPLYRLATRSSNVRREDKIAVRRGVPNERIVWLGRLVGKDIKARASNLPFLKRYEERLFINDVSARGVYDYRGEFHGARRGLGGEFQDTG